jgi:predicted O-methyltransferase YrrM
MTSQEMYPELYTLRFYLKQSLKMLQRHPVPATVNDMFTQYKKWKAEGYEKIFVHPTPWMAPSAVRFISQICNQSSVIFEFGSGSSTLYFAERVKQVISVEHNPEWFNSMQQELTARAIRNAEIHLKEAELRLEEKSELLPREALHYASVFEAYNKFEFSAYAKMIEQWPEDSFDLVIVDGRARPSCLHHAWARVKKGGYLILDNSDRPHYRQEVLKIEAKAVSGMKFYGPVAQNPMFQETSFWQK